MTTDTGKGGSFPPDSPTPAKVSRSQSSARSARPVLSLLRPSRSVFDRTRQLWATVQSICAASCSALSRCSRHAHLQLWRPLCCQSAGVCWRSPPDPVFLGITSGGCKAAKIAACSFLWKLRPSREPARCQPELFCMR
ncbi:coiled-coil-helix-coiled-coil-helix domain-containing protein 5 isoform X4 [Pan troglodytes]